MEVDVSSDHDIAHFFMSNGTKKLHLILQHAPLQHLLEVNGLGS